MCCLGWACSDKIAVENLSDGKLPVERVAVEVIAVEMPRCEIVWGYSRRFAAFYFC